MSYASFFHPNIKNKYFEFITQIYFLMCKTSRLKYFLFRLISETKILILS